MIEGEAVMLLLSGNDTGCFTTEQFAEAKERVLNRLLGPRPSDMSTPPLRNGV